MRYKGFLLMAMVGAGLVAGLVLGLRVGSSGLQREDLASFSRGQDTTELVAETPELRRPEVLSIPKLEVTTEVEYVGLDAEGNMDVPKDADNVAWYMHGPVPGEQGNAVLAGHLDSETGPAVFYHLRLLEAGDRVEVTNEDGETVTFQVTHLAQYPVEEFPLEEVFGKTSTSRLNLITCTGSFDEESRNYSHRTVVYTERI